MVGNRMQSEVLVFPKDLRPSGNQKSPKLKEIKNCPGYYKWWANKKDFLKLLSKLGSNFSDIENAVEQKNGDYCIYVGIAVKESIRSRINWHVNDVHDKKRVEKGYLSTLRKSISSVIASNQLAKHETNEFMNRLKVEIFYSNNEIKSAAAKKELEDIEKKLMLKNLYIINIRDNNHPLALNIKKILKNLRKKGKEAALK